MMSSIRSYKGIACLGKGFMWIPVVLVGDIELDDDASIWPLVQHGAMLTIFGLVKRTNIQDGSVPHVTHKPTPEMDIRYAGDDVTSWA